MVLRKENFIILESSETYADARLNVIGANSILCRKISEVPETQNENFIE